MDGTSLTMTRKIGTFPSLHSTVIRVQKMLTEDILLHIQVNGFVHVPSSEVPLEGH
jgi:hypothetical protein